ncbi:MAG: hypothetical protein JWQ44_891 [Chthoniobacter sp.]|jgi:hypothetical protein|nr:hypothetical protein [Chthoniobacter sp.]
MTFCRVGVVILALLLGGCFEPYKKVDKADRERLKHVAGDTNFQAVVGRLRAAARKKDLPMLASMMTEDFGYSADASAQPGAAIFTHWDEQNLWPVLSDLLKQNFVPLGEYMVSPPELVSDSSYNGPRCGLRVVRGSWKLAYFLPSGEGL